MPSSRSLFLCCVIVAAFGHVRASCDNYPRWDCNGCASVSDWTGGCSYCPKTGNCHAWGSKENKCSSSENINGDGDAGKCSDLKYPACGPYTTACDTLNPPMSSDGEHQGGVGPYYCCTDTITWDDGVNVCSSHQSSCPSSPTPATPTPPTPPTQSPSPACGPYTTACATLNPPMRGETFVRHNSKVATYCCAGTDIRITSTVPICSTTQPCPSPSNTSPPTPYPAPPPTPYPTYQTPYPTYPTPAPTPEPDDTLEHLLNYLLIVLAVLVVIPCCCYPCWCYNSLLWCQDYSADDPNTSWDQCCEPGARVFTFPCLYFCCPQSVKPNNDGKTLEGPLLENEYIAFQETQPKEHYKEHYEVAVVSDSTQR